MNLSNKTKLNKTEQNRTEQNRTKQKMFKNTNTNNDNIGRNFHSNHHSGVNPFNRANRFSSSNEERIETSENNRLPGGQKKYRIYYPYRKSKEEIRKPVFDVKNENFPSLSSHTSENSKSINNHNVMNFSQKLQSKILPTEQVHIQEKKKFVSLVNLSKKHKHVEEEEFVTDEENDHVVEEYNSMDEELEEFYDEQRAKEDYFDYDY